MKSRKQKENLLENLWLTVACRHSEAEKEAPGISPITACVFECLIFQSRKAAQFDPKINKRTHRHEHQITRSNKRCQTACLKTRIHPVESTRFEPIRFSNSSLESITLNAWLGF